MSVGPEGSTLITFFETRSRSLHHAQKKTGNQSSRQPSPVPQRGIEPLSKV